jgi:hypothetical protein
MALGIIIDKYSELVWRLVRQPVPHLLGVVSEIVQLHGEVRSHQVCCYKVPFRVDASRVADGNGTILNNTL